MSESASIRPDLLTCDREPVHVPGNIQPHGFLVAAPVDSLLVSHVSENFPARGGARAWLGRSLAEFLGANVADALGDLLAQPQRAARPAVLAKVWSPADAEVERSGPSYGLLVHVRSGFVVVEGEETCADAAPSGGEGYHELKLLLTQLEGIDSLGELYRLVTDEMRELTGFDRVLIYQFDAEWNGSVVAESGNGLLPSYLGHRFPASDIPAPARALYQINRLRFIASSDYAPVKILAAAAELPPLDLSLSTLRGVSPIHLEYMRNMGTGCSMSVALMRGARLWGLLSCHGREARCVPFATRARCDLLGHVLSLQLEAREQAWELSGQVELRAVLARLVTQMASEDEIAATFAGEDLLKLTRAHGVALVRGEEVRSLGEVPSEKTLQALRAWVAPRCVGGVFAPDGLAKLVPLPAEDAARAGGLLAISISPTDRSCVLWFRAEWVETVSWGGNPHKTLPQPGVAMEVHPRKSFESWQEVVRGRSEAWRATELDAAMGFRRAVIDVVLKKAAEKALLLTELQRMNRELEAFSYTVSHDLRAPFRHVRGYAELIQMEKGDLLDDEGRMFLQKILNAADYAGTLVDTMLTFSQMSMTGLNRQQVNLNDLVSRAQVHGEMQARGRRIDWDIGPLPTVSGDAALLQVVFQNLLDNAVKYTAKRDAAKIRVTCRDTADEWIVAVQDNGAGFDMKYAGKLFGIFQRLHANESFAGLGIGLATVRRVLERHGGRIWAESTVGEGACFHVALPKVPPALTSYQHA